MKLRHLKPVWKASQSRPVFSVIVEKYFVVGINIKAEKRPVSLYFYNQENIRMLF